MSKKKRIEHVDLQCLCNGEEMNSHSYQSANNDEMK